jgi:hypothetical protein
MLRRVLLVVSFFVFSSLVVAVPGYAASTSRTICSHTKRAGYARCNAQLLTDAAGNILPLASASPAGYGPAVFRAAYNAHGTAAGHIAIVSSYDAPTMSQTGNTTYPAKNSSWAVEISLDVESAHGMCPNCRISLIKAESASMNDLGQATDTAVATGASVVSNYYGGVESSGEAQYDTHYHMPSITMVVSSGDSGYGTDYPAASPWVVAVGGTHLQMNATDSRVVSETAWQSAGSACSLFEPYPGKRRPKCCSLDTLRTHRRLNIKIVRNAVKGPGLYFSRNYLTACVIVDL